MLLHFLEFVSFLFVIDNVDDISHWRVRWVEGRFFEFIVKDRRRRGFAVKACWYFGIHDSVLLGFIINNRNGRFGDMSMMTVAVFHACMEFQSVSASTWTSPLASIVKSTTPSELDGIFVFLATRMSRGASCLSSTIAISLTLSPSCYPWSFFVFGADYSGDCWYRRGVLEHNVLLWPEYFFH